MNLETTYLGLTLKHPILPGASPMTDQMDAVRRLEDGGASAIVMHSLFEEQFLLEERALARDVERHTESYSEALSYFPLAGEYRLGPDDYYARIASIKAAVSVPVIASLNGYTIGGWIASAASIQQAGADALELNLYHLATDPGQDGAAVEQMALDVVAEVRRAVSIPIAVKLSPFYSSLPHLAQKLVGAGANGLVLFNRFYQPDIDTEALQVVSSLHLSDSSELLLRLRWIAILRGGTDASLALTGGVHEVGDCVKSIMAGADAIQVVSTLLKRGCGQIAELRDGLARWMEAHEYESVRQMRGSMSLEKCPDPSAFERANYLKILAGYKP